MEHRLYYWKISCIIGRPIVVLEDQLYYWKSTVLLEDLLRCWKMNGRSKVLLENLLYRRQSTGLDGNYRSRKITVRRWLYKYSEQNAVHLASPDTYIKCAIQTSEAWNTLFFFTWVRWSTQPTVTVLRHVRPSVRPSVSMGLWYWELMSRPDPAVLPVGTLHSLEWFWVSRRIFIYSHHNTYVFSLRCPSVRLERFPGICRRMHRGIGL